MITAANLSVHLGDAEILKAISFNLPGAALSAVIGNNGAGKTTLLRALCGLQKSSGDVTLSSRRLSDHSRIELARAASWVPQFNYVPFPFSALDTVVIGRYPWHFGRPTKKDHDIATAALATLGVEKFARRAIPTLSAGERQRVLIARALAAETPLVFLDEPCANLDIGASVRLLQLLRQLADDGRTIVLSIHDLWLAAKFTNQALALQAGRLVAIGPTATVITPPLVKDLFGVDYLSRSE